MELNPILIKYDSLERIVFQELDVFNELEEFYKNKNFQRTKFEIAQSIALGFSENYSGVYEPWGTYFGPMYVAGGIESPSIEFIDTEILEYWKIILGKVNNPILKARYSGLIWDFTKNVTSQFPDVSFCTTNINALIKVSELKNAQNEYTVFRKLERAINLTLNTKNNELFETSKDALIALEEKVEKYDSTGLWGYAFDILIASKNVFEISEEDEVRIINKLQFIFNHFCELGKKNVYDPFNAEHAISRLLIYFKRKNNTAKIFVLLRELKFLYIGLINLSPNQIVSGWIERLLALFNNYNINGLLSSEITELIIRLKDVNKNSNRKIRAVEFSTTFDKAELDKLDSFVDIITTGTPLEILSNISFHFIPDEDKARSELLKLSKNNHIRHLFGTVIKDHNGNIIAKIGPLKTDPDGNLVRHLIDHLNFNYLLLRKVFEKLVEKGISNIDLQKYIFDSGIIDDLRKPIFENAFEAYFKSDHIVFAHLIIPQIEVIIRNIINKAGGTSLYLKKNGSFEELSFEKALKDPIIVGILGKNLIRYLEIVFIDKRGWNLRNRVSHGLMDPNSFNQMTTDYILHSLICFGLIRIN